MSQLQRLFVAGTPSIVSKALIEFLGCMIFHFIGSVSPTPVANGLALIVIVYFTAKISGAHINPAVSLTFCALGHICPLELFIYWISQIMGCAMGALWICALSPLIDVRSDISAYRSDPSNPPIDGCFVPSGDLTRAQVFGWEGVGTFCFIVPIFSVVWYTQNKKGYGNTGPIIVGLSLFASALAAGPFTGASFNPARSLGSPIVFDCPANYALYAYILGQIAGALSAAIVIAPWYGISSNPWYANWMPSWLACASKGNVNMITLKIKSDEAV